MASLPSVRTIDIGEDERVILNVRTNHYIKLRFGSVIICLREENGVVYQVNEQVPIYYPPPDMGEDPLWEMAKALDTIEEGDNESSGFDHDSLSSDEPDELAGYDTDDEPALSYHFGDTQEDTQLEYTQIEQPVLDETQIEQPVYEETQIMDA